MSTTATKKGKKCGKGFIPQKYTCRKVLGAPQKLEVKTKAPASRMATAIAAGASLLGVSAASYLALKARYRSGLKSSALQVARDAKAINPRSLPDVSGKQQITIASPGFGGHGGKERGQKLERKFFKGMQTIMGDTHAVIGIPNEQFNLDPFQPDKWKVKNFNPETAYSDNKVVQAAFAKEAFKKMIGTTLKGNNPESLKLATQAYALHLKHPEKPINIVGYSAGGMIAKEAGEHLNLLGVEPKIITIGTPWFGILDPKNTYDITSKKDAVVAKLPVKNPVYFNDVKAHLGYLPNPKVQETLHKLTALKQRTDAKGKKCGKSYIPQQHECHSGQTQKVSQPNKSVNKDFLSGVILAGSTVGVGAAIALSLQSRNANYKNKVVEKEKTTERKKTATANAIKIIKQNQKEFLESPDFLNKPNSENVLWQPKSTLKQARQFANTGVYPKTVYHATSKDAAKSIESGGFNLSFSKVGRAYGNGVYVGLNKKDIEPYKNVHGEEGRVLSLKINPKKVLDLDHIYDTADKKGVDLHGLEPHLHSYGASPAYTSMRLVSILLDKDKEFNSERLKIIKESKQNSPKKTERLHKERAESEAFQKILSDSDYDAIKLSGGRDNIPMMVVFSAKNITVFDENKRQDSVGDINPAQRLLLAKLIKIVLESVFTDGIDGFPHVESDNIGGFTGKFNADREIYDYFITSNGQISYVETDTRTDTVYVSAFLNAQPQNTRQDKKKCIKGKPCKDTCIAKDISCRANVTPSALPTFKAAQSLLNIPSIPRLEFDNELLKKLQKAAPYIAASLGITAVGGVAAYLATKNAKSFISEQLGASITPQTESFYKNAKHPKRYLNGIEIKSSDPDDYKTTPDSTLFEEPPYPSGVTGANRKAGVTIIEPDGRVWMMESEGAYGGEFHGFPRGGAEEGLTDQQNAIKESHEEVGLQVRIIDHLGDFDHHTGKPVKPGDKPKAVTRQYIGVRVGGNPADAHYETAKVKLATLNDSHWMTAFNSKRDQNSIVQATKNYVQKTNKQALLQSEHTKLRVGASKYDTIEDLQKNLARYKDRDQALQGELGLSKTDAASYGKSLEWWMCNSCQKIISGVQTGEIKNPDDVQKVMDKFGLSYSRLSSKYAQNFATNPEEAFNNARKASEHLTDFMEKAPKLGDDTPIYRGMSFHTQSDSDSFISALNTGLQPKRWMSWADNQPQTQLYMNSLYSGPHKVMVQLDKPKDPVIFSPWADWDRWHKPSKALGHVYKMKDLTPINKKNNVFDYIKAVSSNPKYTEVLNQKDTRYRLKDTTNKGNYKVARIEEY